MLLLLSVSFRFTDLNLWKLKTKSRPLENAELFELADEIQYFVAVSMPKAGDRRTKIELVGQSWPMSTFFNLSNSTVI